MLEKWAQPARCSAVGPTPRRLSRESVGLYRATAGSSSREAVVTLEVLRINMLQLQAVDHVGQTFTARYILQFVIRGGVENDDLMRDISEKDPSFPADGRPGASWYLEQLDFPTALSFSILSRKLVPIGSDLHLVVKVSGVFFETMELQDFPIDRQRLTMVLCVNCSREGIVPVRFDNIHLAATAVDCNTFAMANIWTLYPKLLVERSTVEPMPGRTYPALSVSTLVARKPTAYATHVMLPMSSLTALSLLSFVYDERDAASRMTYSSTILLTSATYKLFVATTIPAVAYVTLLDKYLIVCYMLMACVVADGAMVSLVPRWTGSDAVTAGVDWAFLAVFGAVFVAAHVYMVVRVRQFANASSRSGHDHHLFSAESDSTSYKRYHEQVTNKASKQQRAAARGRRKLRAIPGLMKNALTPATGRWWPTGCGVKSSLAPRRAPKSETEAPSSRPCGDAPGRLPRRWPQPHEAAGGEEHQSTSLEA